MYGIFGQTFICNHVFRYIIFFGLMKSDVGPGLRHVGRISMVMVANSSI